MTAPKVLGIDPSLTGTGLATGQWVDTITTRGMTGHARLQHIRRTVGEHLAGVDLVVMEGPAFGAKGSAYHQLAGLWWILSLHLAEQLVPTAIVPPSALKRYATGKGNADKDAVLAAVIRRYPEVPVMRHDEADAHTLAAIGLRHLGHPLEASLPDTHLAALKKIEWPEVAR